jgi:hypothetical protein
MNRWQKIAWYNLTLIVVSLLLAGAAIGTLTIIIGMPGALGGSGFLGFLGLLGLQPVLFRKGKSKISYDERDAQISRKSVILGFTASYLFFVFACMGCWWYARADGMINIRILPLMVLGGYIASELVRSISLLVQYGRKEKDHE